MSIVTSTARNALAAAGQGKPSPFHVILGETLREVINRRPSLGIGGGGEGLVRGGRQGFESTEVRDWRKETMERLDRGIMFTIVSSTPFSKHLMILNLMAIANSIIF